MFSVLSNGCIVWNGTKAGVGYGVLSINKRNYYVHRLSYRMFKGHIPNNMFVCHHCDNPSCYNPDHLFLGTPQDNVKDMIAKGRSNFVPKGVFKGKRFYSKDQYLEMRKMKDMGLSNKDIRQTFNISAAQLYRILTNKTVE